MIVNCFWSDLWVTAPPDKAFTEVNFSNWLADIVTVLKIHHVTFGDFTKYSSG